METEEDTELSFKVTRKEKTIIARERFFILEALGPLMVWNVKNNKKMNTLVDKNKKELATIGRM